MTLTLMSNLRCVLVTRNGASAAISRTRRPRYASGSFSLTVIRPSPGWMRTRAMAFLRRPVPRLNVSANLDVPSRIERDDLRLRRDVAMVGSGVNAESLEHVGAQSVALQHSSHRIRDRERGINLLRPPQRPLAKPSGIARVPGVLLPCELGAADLDLGRVDYNDVVASVQVRRERGLVLAPQDLGHAARETAEYLIRGINHEPITLQVSGFRRPGLLFAHLSSCDAPALVNHFHQCQAAGGGRFRRQPAVLCREHLAHPLRSLPPPAALCQRARDAARPG